MPEDNEIKILNDKLGRFIEETRKNFGDINDSLDTFEQRLEDNFRKTGNLENEFYLLKNAIEDNTKSFNKKTREIKEHIDGGTKVIVKEVDRARKRWYQFWKKNKGGEN